MSKDLNKNEENTAQEESLALDKADDAATAEKETSAKKSDGKESKKSDKKTDKNSEKKARKKTERRSRRELKARAFRRGWFSAVLVVLFVAAVVLVNFIATTLNDKLPALTIDTTGTNNFELTKETLEFLPGLRDDIRIIVLAEEKEYREGGEYYIQADALLHEYENNSDKITLEYVDMASNPTFSSKYPDESLSYYGVIVECDKGYKYLKESDMFDVQLDYNTYSYYIAGSNVEQAVTSAILNVTLDDKPKVTFISDINGEDYSYFKSYLDTNGFETDEVSPAVGSIPEDTEILVLFAPSVDLDETFVNSISDYLINNGEYGKQFVYLPSGSLTELPNIDSLAEEWGMAVENGYAIENDENYMAPFGAGYYIFAAQYADSTYTAQMKNSALPYCVIGYARPVDITGDSASALLTLSDKSTVLYPAESEDNAAEPVSSPNLAIGAIAQKGTTKSTDSEDSETETMQSHMVVIGSSVSMSETLLKSGVYGNSTYILSLFNTLTERENAGIAIESKTLENSELGITSAQIRVLGTLFIAVIPLGVLIAGIVIFVKRRNM